MRFMHLLIAHDSPSAAAWMLFAPPVAIGLALVVFG